MSARTKAPGNDNAMAGVRITALERMVADRLSKGTDPWHNTGGIGSRKVSAALGRLENKGIAELVDARWRLTAAGRAALELARRLERGLR